jgi:hypothetical protein
MLFLLLHGAYSPNSPCPVDGKPGIWSKEAVYLCSKARGAGFTRDVRVYSPDHGKAVDVTGDHWSVEVSGKKLGGIPRARSYVSFYPAELSWAPDSLAFYITQSDATSEINGFRTDVFLVSKTVRGGPNINQVVEAQFKRDHACVLRFQEGKHVDDASFNVAGLKWTKGSQQMIIAVEIPPDSACGPRGYFGGYAIDLRYGSIAREYSPSELSQHWRPYFGKRLKDDYGALTARQRALAP